MKPTLLAPLLLHALVVSSAATSIGINFYDSGNTVAHTIPAAESAGISPLQGSLWNQFGFAFGVARNTLTSPLSDSKGTPNIATLSLDLNQSYVGHSGASGSPAGDLAMMASYISWDPVDGTAPEDTGSISITGLGSDFTMSGYDVYIYFDADVNNRTFTFTLNGTSSTPSADSSTWSGTFNEASLVPGNGNVAIFRGLTAADLTLIANSNTGRAAVNAIQIVSGNGPAISSFTTSDAYVSPGSTVTLSWNAPAFESLTLDPGNIDATALTTDGIGSYPLPINSTTEFTLTATVDGESLSRTLLVNAGPPRPNILFFFVDDMGWQDTSEPFLYDNRGNEVVTPLNTRYRTPNMEVLADRGMKFTNAYAMPVCSPSRTCWITGLNSARHHVTNWTNSNGTDNDQNSTTSHNSPTHWEKGGLSDTHQTLPALLQSAGYHTIHAGKAHFGATPYAKQPLNIGFDVNIAGSQIGHPASYFANNNFGTGSNHVTGLESYHGSGLFLTEVLTLEMNKAIEQAVNDGSPFFAYMAHYAVHSPFQTDPRFSGNYPGVTGDDLAYATLLEGMDKSLGDILAKLDQLGVAENTFVVFMSDNGGDAPFSSVNDSNAPLRHKKGSKYEGGVREPFIASWAKRNDANPFQVDLPIPAGSHQDDIIAVFDLFPTFASVAGTPFTHSIDGHDLTPYFRAESGTHRPQELLIHFPHDHRSDYFTIFREGDWKLIYNYPSNSYELYNLATDLSETTDLAGSQPERVMRMSRKMARQLADAGAQWPTFAANSNDDPYAVPNLPNIDVDADGIPDNTEDPNANGLVDPGETNPDSDNTDGDPTKDGDEIRTGTDPLDGTSFFRLTPQRSGGHFILSWPSAPGARYRIESSTDLASSPWLPVEADFPASTGTSSTYDLGPIQLGATFYRIVLK